MIFITDLDKTFLRSDLSISEFSKNVWNNFNYPLTIATARSLTGSLNLLEGLKLDYPMILLDGAMIADSKRIYKINALDKAKTDEIIFEVYKNFKEYPLIVGFNEIGDEKFLYPKELNIYQKELLNHYKNDKRVLNIDNLEALEFNLKLVYLGNEEVLKEIEKFAKKFEVETKLTKDAYMDCFFLTILHPLGDKGHALNYLKEILKDEEVVVFGDNINDLGMFKKAKKSIAVKNALDEVKKEADIILPHTNDEDAVARYLYKLKKNFLVTL